MRQQVQLLTSNYNKRKLTSGTAQQVVNFYLESFPQGPGNSNSIAALPTPGLTLAVDLGGNQVRPGGLFQHQGTVYAVAGNTIYSVNPTLSFTKTAIGTLNGSTGNMIIGAINKEVVFCDVADGTVWSYREDTATFQQITAAQFSVNSVQYPVISVVGFNGYFLYLLKNSNYVMVSNLNDGRTIGALSFFSANSFYNNIIAMTASETFVYLFSDISCEVWYLSGGPTVPFDRVSGGVLQYGILSPFSYSLIQDNVVFMATDQNGFLGPAIVNGPYCQPIPNKDLVSKINGYLNLQNCYSFSENVNGHNFFTTTFPLCESVRGRTWSIDVGTGMWHERSSYNSTGQLFPTDDQYRASSHVYININTGNLQLIGDYYSGKIYIQDQNVYTENGTVIKRTITSPHMVDNGNFISVYNVELEVERGQGLDIGLGSSPTVIYQYSKDRAHTWSNEIQRTASVKGRYRDRVRIGSIGGGRAITQRVTVTDPIYWAFFEMSCQVEREDPTYGRMIGLE